MGAIRPFQRLERRQGILHARRGRILRDARSSCLAISRAEFRQTTDRGRRRAASRTCRSSRPINQRVDRVPLCVSHAGMAFAADREAVPQCVQLGDRFSALPGSVCRAVPWQLRRPAPPQPTEQLWSDRRVVIADRRLKAGAQGGKQA